MWPQFWTLVGAALAAAGVTWEPSPAVKAVVAAAAALVVAVIQWQHHKTIRHADSLAADLARTKAARAAAVSEPEAPAAAPAPSYPPGSYEAQHG